MISKQEIYDDYLYDCHVANRRLTNEDWIYYEKEEHHIEVPSRDGGVLTPLNSQHLTKYQHWIAGVLQSEVLGKCCFAYVPAGVLPSSLENIRIKYCAEGARRAFEVHLANTSHEERVRSGKRLSEAYLLNTTTEQRSGHGRKGAEVKMQNTTPEQRSESGRNGQAKLTKKQLSDRAIRGAEALTPEQRSDRVRRGNASLTPEQRSDRARRGNASLTPEQRSERVRRSWEARRANAAKRAKEKEDGKPSA